VFKAFEIVDLMDPVGAVQRGHQRQADHAETADEFALHVVCPTRPERRRWQAASRFMIE